MAFRAYLFYGYHWNPCMTLSLNAVPFSPAASTPIAAPRTFWVIEDDRKWQEAFRLLLGMACQDAHIYTAQNRFETLAWVNQNPSPQWPDLVLMDWQLADGDDGLMLAHEWVKQGFPAHRIIIVSGAENLPVHQFTSVSKLQAAKLLVPTILGAL
jgi:CheY-like chemotaxis protein